jgi:ribosomal protein S18 acetylase RimI-like enzyme
MLVYRFLNDTSTETLHSAFHAAFAEYHVDMLLSLGELEYRLRRDGVDTSISAGAFFDDQLVGFTLNAGGIWQGQSTVYDAGTGVSPSYRGRGIATRLFEFMLPRLRDLGYRQYLLEVLTSNTAAVELYKKLGFTDSRRLAVLRSSSPVTRSKIAAVEIREPGTPNWNLYRTFWEGYPSWQNSIDASQRVADTIVALEAYIGEACVGYGVVSRTSGNLFQLAVHNAHRRKGIGSTLLPALQTRVVTNEPIKVNNIDEELKQTIAFFQASGFMFVLEQYELCLQIEPAPSSSQKYFGSH